MNLLCVNPTVEMMSYIWRPCPFCDRQHAPVIDCLTARFTCVACGAPAERFNDYWLPPPWLKLYCKRCGMASLTASSLFD